MFIYADIMYVSKLSYGCSLAFCHQTRIKIFINLHKMDRSKFGQTGYFGDTDHPFR